MKYLSLSLLVLIALFSSCDNNGSKNEIARLTAELDSVNAINAEQHDRVENLSSLVDVITESLDSISQQEELLLGNTPEGGKISKKELKNRLNQFAGLLQRQKDKIEKLEASLAGNVAELSKLKKVIDFLNAQISEKEDAIASLQTDLEKKNVDIDNLNEKVQGLVDSNAGLQTKVDLQQTELEANVNAMNECYYTVGTKDELKKAGMIEGGGFLKKAKFTMSFINNGVFKKADIRNLKYITVPSSKFKILTQVPQESYVTTVDGNTTTITIKDADKFWSISKYLVVEAD